MLKQNGVYEWGSSKWRLINMDANGCCLYRLGSKGIKYQVVAAKEIDQMVANGEIKPIEDPYANISINNAGPQREHGEKRWEIIHDLVSNPAILFNKTARAEKIREIERNQKISMKHVYKLLALWWEKGQRREALNPEYGKSTGRRNGTTKIGVNVLSKASL